MAPLTVRLKPPEQKILQGLLERLLAQRIKGAVSQLCCDYV